MSVHSGASASIPTENAVLDLSRRSHPTGHEVTDAWIAGFLHAVGRQPWDDMHDYAAVCAMDYAASRPSVWTRFRDDDAEWPCYEEWPEGCENERDLLVWNRCDGFHIWWKSFGECPPGTHWARLPVRPTPTPSQAQDGYGAAPAAECTCEATCCCEPPNDHDHA